MTYRKALKIIRANTREGDWLEETFKTICRNRYCHPVKEWAIYDISKAKNQDENVVRNMYNRHLKRLEEIFRAQLEGYL